MDNLVSAPEPQPRIQAHRVCPWWIGYLLASPVRRILYQPSKVLGPYVRPGMTVLEPGPGMGFFTLELAHLVGASGRVVAVDIQPRMLAALKRRAARARVLDRLDARLATPDSLGLSDLDGAVDFTLVFAVVHELPSAGDFFLEAARASKPGAQLLLVEPGGHVSASVFEGELRAAKEAGFTLVESPSLCRSHAALLEKSQGSSRWN
jgi:SAM-dependent methyltransferase